MFTILEMKLAQIKNDYKVHGDVDFEDIEWLIEQTEKMQKIECETNRFDVDPSIEKIIEIVNS